MRIVLNAVCAAVLAAMVPGGALAEADGPDFYQITGVASGNVLHIREKSSVSSAKIGSIPHDADGIRNLGCEGGLSYAEWEAATKQERSAGAHQRWCQISYKGVEGWVAGWLVSEGSAPLPAFDCAKSAGSVEREICTNPQLARLDQELARLYGLAENGQYMTPARLPELQEMQRDWIKERNNCSNSGAELSACIAGNYATWIHFIRTGNFDSRQDDDNGISSGPFAYNCNGLDGLMSMGLATADPSMLSLSWRETSI